MLNLYLNRPRSQLLQRPSSDVSHLFFLTLFHHPYLVIHNSFLSPGVSSLFKRTLNHCPCFINVITLILLSKWFYEERFKAAWSFARYIVSRHSKASTTAGRSTRSSTDGCTSSLGDYRRTERVDRAGRVLWFYEIDCRSWFRNLHVTLKLKVQHLRAAFQCFTVARVAF